MVILWDFAFWVIVSTDGSIKDSYSLFDTTRDSCFDASLVNCSKEGFFNCSNSSFDNKVKFWAFAFAVRWSTEGSLAFFTRVSYKSFDVTISPIRFALSVMYALSGLSKHVLIDSSSSKGIVTRPLLSNLFFISSSSINSSYSLAVSKW